MSHLQKSPHIPLQTVPSNQCLTGCLYQVIQTTGLQGSNVLKLLPILKSKDHLLPTVPLPLTPSASTLHVPRAVISSPPPPVSILSRPGPVSVQTLLPTPTLGKYIIAAQNPPANAAHVEPPFSLHQEAKLLPDNRQLTVPTNPAPGNPTILMMNTRQTSPVKPIPSGHSLQIPAHAEVISLPVSSLPFSIQQKILPQSSVTDANKVPSVIYVSPVNTVKASNNQSSPPYPSPNTSSLVSGTKSPLQQRLLSTGAETPKGPMKWVVQESDACLVPVKSSNDTASKILQLLSKTKMEDVTLSNPDNSKVVQIKDNALVMCNNKIFFLTKKGTELIGGGSKNVEPSPEKPAAQIKSPKDLSNKVVQVVLSKNKSPPPPSAEELVQSNVVSTAKPKRKSSTPRPNRGDPSVIYIPDDDEGCSNASTKPPDTSCNPPAYNGDAVKESNQLLPKSQGTEIETEAKAPEVNEMDDRSWRLKFGLLKKEKIVLKRIPLIRWQGTHPAGEDQSDPAEEQQLKRKSSEPVEKVSKKQKSVENSDGSQEASPDSPSPLPVSGSYSVPRGRSPGTIERSSATWSATYLGGEASYPPDIADFQVDQEVTGHSSDPSLPSQKFHMDSFSSMYSDETTKDEKIQRLKEVLKEREKALEVLRRQKKTT